MTKRYRNTYIFLTLLSWILCYGIAAFLIVLGIVQGEPSSEEGVIISNYIGPVLYSTGISILIMLVLSIIVKDKLEPTVWMVNIILAGYMFGMPVVYSVFAAWFVNNYIIKFFKERYKAKYLINKEIDKRG